MNFFNPIVLLISRNMDSIFSFICVRPKKPTIEFIFLFIKTD